MVEVLHRKIALGHAGLDALKTIFGVELMPDNVSDCKARLLKIVAGVEPITEEHIQVVNSNIVCADALKFDFEFKPA